jgi:peptidoglycan/xylan/chitin deacetylase (PgdA/CDA1 family)
MIRSTTEGGTGMAKAKQGGWIRVGIAALLAGVALTSMAATKTQTASTNATIPQVIYNGPRDEKRIAITFDACSSIHLSKVDKKVVQILVSNHIPATIFLGGKWVLDQPKEAKYLASIPFFEIANHSFHHPHLTRLSDAGIRHELQAAQKAIESVTGVTPRYFRAPYGEYNSDLVRIAASLGLTTIQFDLASGDPDKSFTAERLSRWVIHKAKSGSIVVMHINTRGWHTAEALPIIIKALRAEGYSFVTISELLNEPFPAPPSMVLAGNSDMLDTPQQGESTQYSLEYTAP